MIDSRAGRGAAMRAGTAFLFLLQLVAVLAVSPGVALGAVPDEVDMIEWCAGQKDCLAWTVTAGAEEYIVYRGDEPDLAGLLGVGLDSCTVGTFGETTTGAGVADPEPGVLHWYLVTAGNVDGEGPAGQATEGPRVVNSAGACGSGTAGLILNEVDYDQPGIDFGEFVEIRNTAGATRGLTDVVLILVNGQNSQEYERVALADAGATIAAGAYLVVGSPDVVAALPPGTPSVTFTAASNNAQNGAPDGVALFDTATETLLDALSYEGSITDAQFAGVAGTFNLVEGAAATVADSNSITGSLARFPDGSDTNDASTDWWFNNVPSPGLENPIP
jgi:hypothetical protein